MKHDRQVLRFYAYFKEAVVENPNENFRIRKCVINYHLDDDTMYVGEPKIENSGLPQGVFLKRHKVPKGDGSGDTYTWQDLDAQMELEMYSRVYRITGYDDFTRSFYESENHPLTPCEESPDDMFNQTRVMMDMKQNPPDMAETKEYFEVKLNGGNPNKRLERYLANDRKVLQFTILWDDTSYDGGEKTFMLNYFLSDNTMEIKEIKVANSGIDHFSMLLKRMQVPKKPVLTHYPGMSLKKEDYYLPEDLVIGRTITVYNRDVLLINCDEFSK